MSGIFLCFKGGKNKYWMILMIFRPNLGVDLYFFEIFCFFYGIINFFIFFHKKNFYWGLGIGDWGLGIGDWGLGPIPNPQSPIPII